MPQRKRQAGFSLIEVAISIGIVGFAMISILGMIPVGMASFKQAMNNTVESEIVQALTSEISVTSFANISNMAYPNQSYFYDAEGNVVSTSSTSKPTNAIYTAKITLLPVNTTGTSTSIFPITLSNANNSPEAYNVQIQITNITQPNQPHTYSVIVANNNY